MSQLANFLVCRGTAGDPPADGDLNTVREAFPSAGWQPAVHKASRFYNNIFARREGVW
jgi:hypothetical protein